MTNEEKTLIYLTAVEEILDRMTASDGSSRVLEAMRYSLLSGGKRVRGILTLAACEQVGGSFEEAVFAACAIEMVHCYSLIHDDLPAMDNDDMRRGKPSCHIAFGEATAILAGDGLLTLAFQTLAKMPDPAKAAACVQILADAAGHAGMVLGQELDIAAEGHNLTAAQITRIHTYKTGALINASVRMGAVIGGANQQQIDALVDYAQMIGLVFQMVDDVLDQTSDDKTLGKRAGRDKKQKKATGSSVHGVDKAMAIAKDLTSKAIAALNEVFVETSFLTDYAKKLLARKH